MLRRLLISAALLLSGYSHAQNAGCISQNNQLQWNEQLDQYRAFFIGEFHGVKGVTDVKLSLIQFLYEHYGVHDIFIETGYSTAWLYNRFLQTGDTTLLIHPSLVYAGNNHALAFWKELYAYNRDHQAGITIHGMDFERTEFIKTLRLLAPAGKARPISLQPILQYIDTVRIATPDLDSLHGLMTQYNAICNAIDAHAADAATYYGSNYRVVLNILHNKNTWSHYSLRNSRMYYNVLHQVNEEHIGKFIVFAGMNHGDMTHRHSLAAKLAHAASLSDKVCTMAMVCRDCYDRQKSNTRHYRGPFTYMNDTAAMHHIFEQWPANDCSYYIAPSSALPDEQVSGFSRYLILMKDQPVY